MHSHTTTSTSAAVVVGPVMTALVQFYRCRHLVNSLQYLLPILLHKFSHQYALLEFLSDRHVDPIMAYETFAESGLTMSMIG